MPCDGKVRSTSSIGRFWLSARLCRPCPEALRAFTRGGVDSFSMNCPICDKPIEWKDNAHRPFCSERCQLVDLGRWVNEEYSVPGERATIPEQSECPSPSSSAAED